MIPLSIQVYEKGTGGVPSVATLVEDLRARIDSYTHSITDQFGFESMTCSYPSTLEEALDWLANGLGRSVQVFSPEAETCWEGRLTTIEAQIGETPSSMTLDGMANRVRVRYTTVLGVPGTIATASDTTSQALYGIKDIVLSLPESDSTEAGQYQTSMLADLKDPISGPSAALSTGESNEIRLTLTFTGWYGSLDDVLTSSTSTTKTSTTTQVGTLLTTLASTNAFISTATTNITASGITAVEFIADDTPYRQKIEELLKRGNGTNRYAWGVYENREFYAAPYAGASPTTIDYQRWLSDGQLYDSAGGIIRPWMARPNHMFQTVDLLDVSPVSGTRDAAARFYVARVTCEIREGSIVLTLEPAQGTDLAAILVTKYV